MQGSICIDGYKQRLQKQNRCTLDRDAGQGSGLPGAGVDVDSVVTDIGMRNRRMAVHNESSVILHRVEELVTNPDQVFGVLLIEWNVRTNTGVDEKEISARKMIAQTLQEQFVRAGEGVQKTTMQVELGFGSVAREHPIGGKGLHAAQSLPVTKDGRILKEMLHDTLVIATQANRAISNQPDRQQIDHGLRMRAAIDVVAEIDFDRMLDRPAPDVVINACDDLAQQVGPAVDIADCIDARTVRG